MIERLLEPVQAMTVGGWVPWLTDTLHPEHGQVAFHTYVRQDSVILTQGEAGRDHVMLFPTGAIRLAA